MAKTFTAPFAQTPKNATGVATLASVIGTADTPTNTIELLKAGEDGALITKLWAMPRATVTASSLLLFISTDNGTTKRLIDSELMPAQSISATAAIAETKFGNINESTPIRLQAGAKLYVASAVALAAGIVFSCEYTEF
jgi:hypothetical protein